MVEEVVAAGAAVERVEDDIWYLDPTETSHGPVTLATLVEAWRDRRRGHEFPRLVWWEALGGKAAPAWVPIGSEEAKRALGDITGAIRQEASPPGSLLRTDAETPASTDGQKRVVATPPHPDPRPRHQCAPAGGHAAQRGRLTPPQPPRKRKGDPFVVGTWVAREGDDVVSTEAQAAAVDKRQQADEIREFHRQLVEHNLEVDALEIHVH
jgi:hypothetical protein